MKTLLLTLLLTTAADRELDLAREMVEDAVIRNDEEGLRLGRERLLRLIAESNDPAVLRDAHYLVGLAASFEIWSGNRDVVASNEIVASGIRHADRAVELDPKFADGWTLSAILRSGARMLGLEAPDAASAQTRMARAVELDPSSPPAAFFAALMKSFNPAGAAPAEGVKLYEQLVARLDADRAATGRRFGVWDNQSLGWLYFVRNASDAPDPAILRPIAARFLQHRPDSELAQRIAAFSKERQFVAAPNVTWQTVLTDAEGDGGNPKLPDVVRVDRAESGDRLWYRVSFHDPLPRSFGVNLIFDRDGNPMTGRSWWGRGSTFRFDRLVSAWITRDGDRYFGTVGVSDTDGARTAHLTKIPADIQIALADNDRSVILGVPRDVLALTDASAMIAAGGSHLVWNDDATSASNSR